MDQSKTSTCRNCGGTGHIMMDRGQVVAHATGKVQLKCPNCDGKGYETWPLTVDERLDRLEKFMEDKLLVYQPRQS